RSTFVEVVDQTHTLSSVLIDIRGRVGYGCRPQAAPDGGPSSVHGENRLHKEPEAPQHAKQFAVAEGLASRGEAKAPGWLLEQRVRSERLKERGVLVVGNAVDHAVRPAGGSRGVD